MKHARKSRRICQVCQQRPAKFAYRGHVKRDRQHKLCFACYRALTDSHRLAHPLPYHLGFGTTTHRTRVELNAHATPVSAPPTPETA